MVRRRHVLMGVLAALGVAAVNVPKLAGTRRVNTAETLPELRIGTGPPGGVFREIGAALAGVFSSRLPGTHVRCIPTDASLANLALLDAGDADLAFVAVDAVSGGPHRDLTAVARLFDSWMHVLVPEDSPIQHVADLDGRPVAAGAAGSGTRFTTERLLAVAGLRPKLRFLTQDGGAAALVSGAVDAWFTCTGAPTPAVRALARTMRLRLLPMTPYLDAMSGNFDGVYAVATLPSTTYPGISGTPTITTPNLLVARPDVPADVIETVTAGLFSEQARIAREHPEANEINTRSGVATMPVPLHPGALRYFRTTKPYA
jgi:uncharacterized protein